MEGRDRWDPDRFFRSGSRSARRRRVRLGDRAEKDILATLPILDNIVAAVSVAGVLPFVIRAAVVKGVATATEVSTPEGRRLSAQEGQSHDAVLLRIDVFRPS